MQPLTTFEFDQPLVGTIDQQRRQRRAALRKFVKDQLLIHDLRQALTEAEKRVGEQQILLDMATAEADMLRQRIAKLERKLAISEELAQKRGAA